ncbi:transmembrane protein 192 [Biomphalaria pfeifferi]|uniref:Transmembrane protein 192 n=1 Tax=Biomphalaria pfeifferi TaxID=112525 RepID=A0AAD8F3E1_BIOPF|nr:transmembrane protein 192 [Biomphalaria pfeifferi]
MVSLTTQNSHSGGFFGFSEDHLPNLSTNSDDDLIVDHIELVSSPHVLYKPIRTTWAIVLNIILYLCLCASAFLVPYFCPNSKCAEDDISLVMYIHGGIWFLLLGLDRYLLAKHNQSRLNGYLQFYRKTKNIRRLPFMINSCANAVVVVLFNGLDRHFHFKDDPKYLQILVAVESGIAFIFLIIYFVYTVIFNHSKTPPDVTQEEIMTSFVNSQCYSELGYKNENYIDQVLEKQADMIRYLRQHSETLAKRNLVLQEDLKILRNSRSERKK